MRRWSERKSSSRAWPSVGARWGLLLTCLVAPRTAAGELPGAYFRLMEAGIAQVEERLAVEPLDLKVLEVGGDGRSLFPHVVLVAAVLYAKPDPSNHRYRDPKLLSLATRIGDLLASESEQDRFAARLNDERDAYMWLEAYRLLEKSLGEEGRRRWQRELEKNVAALATDVAQRADFPGYQSPFIYTSPNHFALWASTVYLAGRVFGKREWQELAARVLHRFAAVEQSPDGFWGEHERSLPTPGYDYNTYASLALY